MARMIPARVYPECASRGEVEVFRKLRDDPSTPGWIILHSLDIAEHRKQLSGEADFVVIVPSKGVLCIEVKAHSSVRRAPDGIWYYGDDEKGEARGPFKQASAAMHSLRRRLTQARPDLAQVLFWSAVIFPYLTFTARSGEWHDWQVIDRDLFTSRPISGLIEEILDRARERLLSTSGSHWFDDSSGQPTSEECEIIAATLRPQFEFMESAESRSKRLEDELKQYTEEQFGALDAMELNPRVAFEGPAGTGKTMLAVEAARRARAAGSRVLLLCFNRLLGRWLQSKVAGMQPEVTARTLHRQMLDVTGISPESQASIRSFWEDTLPREAVKIVAAGGDAHLYDELIVDEAQDILRDSYLDFLNVSLKGGLASGRWRFFGDFEKQAIYDSANMPLGDFLSARSPGAPVYSLRVNCRNPPRIAEAARLLGGLEPNYRKILRPDNHVEPQLHFYAGPEHQRDMLENTLGRLSKSGFFGRRIVVLSTRADAACIASQLNGQQWKGRLRPYGQATVDQIGYCSVYAFKGMEAPAVVVTDVDQISSPAAAALFYVAITRAVDRLELLVHESARQEVINALMRAGA